MLSNDGCYLWVFILVIDRIIWLEIESSCYCKLNINIFVDYKSSSRYHNPEPRYQKACSIHLLPTEPFTTIGIVKSWTEPTQTNKMTHSCWVVQGRQKDHQRLHCLPWREISFHCSKWRVLKETVRGISNTCWLVLVSRNFGDPRGLLSVTFYVRLHNRKSIWLSAGNIIWNLISDIDDVLLAANFLNPSDSQMSFHWPNFNEFLLLILGLFAQPWQSRSFGENWNNGINYKETWLKLLVWRK